MPRVLFMCYDFKVAGNAQVLTTILQHLDRDVFGPIQVTYAPEREGNSGRSYERLPCASSSFRLRPNAELISNLLESSRLTNNFFAMCAARDAEQMQSSIQGENGKGSKS